MSVTSLLSFSLNWHSSAETSIPLDGAEWQQDAWTEPSGHRRVGTGATGKDGCMAGECEQPELVGLGREGALARTFVQ